MTLFELMFVTVTALVTLPAAKTATNVAIAPPQTPGLNLKPM